MLFRSQPLTVATAGAASALWMGPDEWMLVAPGTGIPDAGALQAAGLIATDVSQGRACLRIAGRDARTLLAKGIPIDLHPRAFAPGRCASTSLARLGVTLHLVDGTPTWHLYAMRSYFVSLWQWVEHSAAEFGYRIDPPVS